MPLRSDLGLVILIILATIAYVIIFYFYHNASSQLEARNMSTIYFTFEITPEFEGIKEEFTQEQLLHLQPKSVHIECEIIMSLKNIKLKYKKSEEARAKFEELAKKIRDVFPSRVQEI